MDGLSEKQPDDPLSFLSKLRKADTGKFWSRPFALSLFMFLPFKDKRTSWCAPYSPLSFCRRFSEEMWRGQSCSPQQLPFPDRRRSETFHADRYSPVTHLSLIFQFSPRLIQKYYFHGHCIHLKNSSKYRQIVEHSSAGRLANAVDFNLKTSFNMQISMKSVTSLLRMGKG